MESFIAKESSIKELEKKQAKQQQNNSFSVFFVKKILPSLLVKSQQISILHESDWIKRWEWNIK